MGKTRKANGLIAVDSSGTRVYTPEGLARIRWIVRWVMEDYSARQGRRFGLISLANLLNNQVYGGIEVYNRDQMERFANTGLRDQGRRAVEQPDKRFLRDLAPFTLNPVTRKPYTLSEMLLLASAYVTELEESSQQVHQGSVISSESIEEELGLYLPYPDPEENMEDDDVIVWHPDDVDALRLANLVDLSMQILGLSEAEFAKKTRIPKVQIKAMRVAHKGFGYSHADLKSLCHYLFQVKNWKGNFPQVHTTTYEGNLAEFFNDLKSNGNLNKQ
ncbi:MAG: hypothetical protein NVS2B14_00070 [Chamaesiphon sp.]